jgi:AraC family transcriptional regulator of adaptative response/methylated-DNA-[protein]-cysteine methyltransferase
MSNYNRIASAIEYIKENFNRQPNLDEIAKKVNLSPYHFQRLFTEWAGVSPKKFLEFLTLSYAKEILKQNHTLSSAAFEAGLSGTGRLHDLFVNIEGMTPGEYKNHGENLIIRYSHNECRFGKYLVASTSKGICNVIFYEDPAAAENELRRIWKNANIIEHKAANHEHISKFLNDDFSSKEKIRLHLKGTPFQLKVWETLLRIPEGKLTTYSNVASFIKHPNAQRAVGTAIGQNPIAYLIPCHRVIKSAGIIGEYRWGSVRKHLMLGWEASKVSGPEV